MLEAALILTVFLTMLISVLDFGQILFIHQMLVERARLAARTAAVTDCDNLCASNLVLYGQRDHPGGEGNGIFGLTPANVFISRRDSGTTAARVVVRIANLSYNSYSPLMAGRLRNIPVTVAVSMETP